jgi:putative DNA primase/helicase
MSDFRAFCESLGLRPGAIQPDGKWRRCPTVTKPRKKNGGYKLSPDGRIGFAWDLAVHDAPATWRPDGGAEPETFSAERLKAARDAARQQRQQVIAATQDARAFFDACAPLRGGHPYLEAKQLDMTGCYGLRVDRDGWLVVPAHRDGALVSYQRISPDGQKLFAPGASIKGASYTIERNAPTLHVICEGLATGLAIYAATSGARVIVAFTAGGLAHAAETLTTGQCVVAADNDHQTICADCRAEGATVARDPRGDTPEGCRCNPGIRAALAASSAVGIGMAVPDLTEGTDWLDWRNAERARRLAAWTRRKHETEAVIHRGVDTQIARAMNRAARLRAPMEG